MAAAAGLSPSQPEYFYAEDGMPFLFFTRPTWPSNPAMLEQMGMGAMLPFMLNLGPGRQRRLDHEYRVSNGTVNQCDVCKKRLPLEAWSPQLL